MLHQVPDAFYSSRMPILAAAGLARMAGLDPVAYNYSRARCRRIRATTVDLIPDRVHARFAARARIEFGSFVREYGSGLDRCFPVGAHADMLHAHAQTRPRSQE